METRARAVAALVNITTLIELARLLLRSPTEKADIELAAAAVALFATPEFSRVESAFEGVAKAYGATVTRDPVSGHVATIGAPAQVGGHPSGIDSGLMR